MAVRLDHLVVACADLEREAAELTARSGLAVLAGGLHPWGTCNAIVPLGDAYLELAAIADETLARQAPFGRLLLGALERGTGVCAWVAEPHDIEAAAAALGVPVETGARLRADGTTLLWRSAGIEGAAADPALPFLIAWDDPDERPGRLAAAHRSSVLRTELVVGADAAALTAHCGGVPDGVVAQGRPPALARATIVTAGGAIDLPCI